MYDNSTHSLIGLEEGKAKQLISENGCVWQIISRDEEPLPVPRNQRLDRFCLRVVDSIIVSAYIG